MESAVNSQAIHHYAIVYSLMPLGMCPRHIQMDGWMVPCLFS
jgi:hypothetical protein